MREVHVYRKTKTSNLHREGGMRRKHYQPSVHRTNIPIPRGNRLARSAPTGRQPVRTGTVIADFTRIQSKKETWLNQSASPQVRHSGMLGPRETSPQTISRPHMGTAAKSGHGIPYQTVLVANGGERSERPCLASMQSARIPAGRTVFVFSK
jgi:hypothetical protein